MTTKKSRPFQAVLLERLANPQVAKHYLNEALEESPESFLNALKTVAQARQIAKVAKDAGVQRETLYRSLSSQGNPTLGTLSSILRAVGLKISIGLEGVEDAPVTPIPSGGIFISPRAQQTSDEVKSGFAEALLGARPFSQTRLSEVNEDEKFARLSDGQANNFWQNTGATAYAAGSY
jgi:probable addiction module antidote protein